MANKKIAFVLIQDSEREQREKEAEELRRHYQRLIDSKVTDVQLKSLERLKLAEGLEDKLQASYEARLREILEQKESEWNVSVSEQSQEIETLTRELSTLRSKSKKEVEGLSKSLDKMAKEHSEKLISLRGWCC